MNYLAHAFLSFEDPQTVVGNLISDFVKGKKKFEYAPAIQRGISLHRSIDGFTDTHPATAEAKAFFRPRYGLYSGAFVDIVYDHFLARDQNVFPNEQSLSAFAKRTYAQVSPYEPIFPDRFKHLFRFMEEQDWLSHYRFREMIKNSFRGLVKRARYMDDDRTAFEVFEKNYGELEHCYRIFFPDVDAYVRLVISRWE
jgi:acyl carrier protein phosphodiesterase